MVPNFLPHTCDSFHGFRTVEHVLVQGFMITEHIEECEMEGCTLYALTI